MPNPLNNNSPLPLRKIHVKKALIQCGTAFSLWFIIYTVFVAHCFVVWKWDTPKTATSLEGPIRDFQAAIARSEQRISDREEQLSDMGRLYRRIQDKIANLQHADKTFIPKLPTTSIVMEEPSLLRLKQLLKIEDIVEYRSASKAISMAISELRNYLENNYHADAVLHPLASLPNLHAALAAASTSMTFQAISLCSESGLSVAQIAEATSGMEKRHINQNTPLPIIQSNAAMESLLETLRLAISDAKTKTSDNKAQRENCLSSLDRPVDWLEASLKAWNSQSKDVRQALLDIMRERDGITDFSLYANLDSFSLMYQQPDATKRFATKRPVAEMPLRDVLDTPSLHALAVYCDALLDLVGGINEGLDDFMDRRFYALLDTDNESLGQMAVDRFLNRTGGLTIQHFLDSVRSAIMGTS